MRVCVAFDARQFGQFIFESVKVNATKIDGANGKFVAARKHHLSVNVIFLWKKNRSAYLRYTEKWPTKQTDGINSIETDIWYKGNKRVKPTTTIEIQFC